MRVYDAELAKLADRPDELVSLGLRTAQIYEVQLGNVDVAIERYRHVLTADERNSTAIRALGRLYEAREQWPEYAEVLRKEVELPDASPDDVIQLRFRLAQVLEGALGDVNGAIAAYRDILDTQSDHTPSIQSLEQIFARKIKQTEVAAILKPIYESQGEWEKLAQLHEAALESLTAPEARLAAMHAQAELFEEKLSDAVGALGWYSRALRETPLDEKSLNEAERLAGSTNAWADLAGTYADVVEASSEDAVKQTIGKKLARIYEDELNDIENAEASYNYVLLSRSARCRGTRTSRCHLHRNRQRRTARAGSRPPRSGVHGSHAEGRTHLSACADLGDRAAAGRAGDRAI